MGKAFVLMTALPPTKGHFNLMNFASNVGEGRTTVIVCTQPHEPYARERFYAVRNAAYRTNGCDVEWLHEELAQDPSVPGFWPMWDRIMKSYGFKPGDIAVSSEAYGQTLADRLGGIFIPYDPARELYYTKATNIRNHMVDYFDDILPEFQKYLRTTVTVFGAESTGKTTVSAALADAVGGHWVYEYARPYLELTKNPINVDSMTAIWKGQRAAQKHTDEFQNKAVVVQDTDLFSTIGYWEQPHWAEFLGPVPEQLIADARELMSDHYVFLKSDIPFEPDPLRYGVDKRESDDSYWVNVANKYDLPFTVVSTGDYGTRLHYAMNDVMKVVDKKATSIFFDRGGL